jgi:hypothetical protein
MREIDLRRAMEVIKLIGGERNKYMMGTKSIGAT